MYHVDDLYASIDAIPAEASKIIFKKNSFRGIDTLMISAFPNLESLIFEDSSFPNADLIDIRASQLKNLTVGSNCFSSLEMESNQNRRLMEDGSLSFFTPQLVRMVIGKGSLLSINTLVLYQISQDVLLELEGFSLSNVGKIQYVA